MTPKPKIQYIGQFYVYGSEAKAPALKQKKKPKTRLPLAKPQEVAVVEVEPLAMGCIALAVVLVVALAVSAWQLHGAWQEYHVMDDYVDRLTAANVALLAEYRSSYDLSEIELRAQAMGMVPAAEAETITIQLHPAPVEEPETWWDDVVWFFRGLLA